jgi:hypothetical protein
LRVLKGAVIYATLSCVGRLYILFPMIKGTRLVWHAAYMGEKRSVYRVLVGKRDGKRPLSRPGCRWEVNIKIGHKAVRREVVDRIDPAESRNKW